MEKTIDTEGGWLGMGLRISDIEDRRAKLKDL